MFIDWQFLLNFTSDDIRIIELSFLVLLHSNNSWKDYAYKWLGSWNYDKSNRPRFHVDTLHDPGIRTEMIDLIFNLSYWYLIGSEINFWWYPIDRTQSSGSIIITHSFEFTIHTGVSNAPDFSDWIELFQRNLLQEPSLHKIVPFTFLTSEHIACAISSNFVEEFVYL